MSKRRPESGIVVISALLELVDPDACESAKARNTPVRVSGVGVDAAEPAVAAASDGSVYLAWVKRSPYFQAIVAFVERAAIRND